MLTRDMARGWIYEALAPPPLHVYDPAAEHAAWHPLQRLVIRPTPPGPVMIHIPVAAPFGEDPSDPNMQTVPRVATAGMVGRLNEKRQA